MIHTHSVRLLWQANVDYSPFTHTILCVGYAGVMLLVMLIPWPSNRWLVITLFLILIMGEGLINRRRFLAAIGRIILYSDQKVFWQDRWWRLITTIRTPWGIWLRLTTGDYQRRLWIAEDSLSMAEWRALCRVLRTELNYR